MKLLKKGIVFIITMAMVITAFAGLTFAASESTHISLKASKTDVYVGDEFTIEIDTSDMKVSTLTGGFTFNSDVVEFVKYEGAFPTAPEYVYINYDEFDPMTGGIEVKRSLIEAKVADNKSGFGFDKPNTSEAQYRATAPLVTVTLKAKAIGDAEILLYEDTDGAEGFKGEKIDPGFKVTVKENTIKSIVVTTAPSKTSYHVGEKFDKTGMIVTATYDNGDTKDVTAQCTVDTTTALKTTDKSVKITFDGKETTQAITVSDHIYTEKWTWKSDGAGNYTDATVELKCSGKGCSDTHTVKATIESKRTEPKCETEGSIKYTAKATYAGKEYIDEKEIKLEALGHDYKDVEPKWTWNADNSKATAAFACTRTGCKHVNEVTVKSTSKETKAPTCTEKGETTYTAKAKAGEGYTEYTDTKKADIAALGHAWDKGTVTKEASATEKGIITYKCTREGCKEEKQEEFSVVSDKIEISSKIELTEELKEAGLSSVDAVKEKLSEVVLKDTSFESKNITTYDISLMVSLDNGKTYVKATKEYFPEKGIDVVIPYPNGTAMKDEFIVSHMISATSDKQKAGDVEVLKVTKTNDGIKVHVDSFSPFAVGAKIVRTEPKTGDNNSTIIWIAIMASAFVLIGMGLLYNNKRKNNR